MDPKDKEIADLKASVATLTTQVTTLTGERDTAVKEAATAKSDVEKLGKDLKDKDTLIDQKNKQIVGARKKFSEMDQKEKDELTEAEQRALQETEENKTRLDNLEKQRQDDLARERASRVDSEIGKYTNKPEIQAAIKKNLENLTTFGKAMTTQEIAEQVQLGINMLGTLKEGSINKVINAGGGEAPGDSSKKGDFADTPEGQAALAKLAPQAVGPLNAAK